VEDVLISSVEGNRQLLDGGAMFGNAPKAMWKKWAKPDEQNRIELACRCLLVQIGEINILLETGIGAFFEPKLADRYGVTPNNQHVLLDSLKTFGIQHTDIHFVILSHLHFDHAGGLLASYEQDPSHRQLLFPNAKYIIGKQAWERANNPHGRDRASFIPEMIKSLEESKRVIIIEKENRDNYPDVIKNHFSFFQTDGHTPGQLHSIIETKSHDIVFCGDLIPGCIWAHIALTMGYDRFPELLIDEKKNLYDSLDLSKTLFFYTHDPNYAASKISKKDKKYQAIEFIRSFNKKVF